VAGYTGGRNKKTSEPLAKSGKQEFKGHAVTQQPHSTKNYTEFVLKSQTGFAAAMCLSATSRR
jgi:hypothetical protein